MAEIKTRLKRKTDWANTFRLMKIGEEVVSNDTSAVRRAQASANYMKKCKQGSWSVIKSRDKKTLTITRLS
jgi:predicted YcjX-like family ATPase